MVDQLKTVSVMRLDQATLIISCIMTSHVQRDSMLFVKYLIMLIIKWVSYICVVTCNIVNLTLETVLVHVYMTRYTAL